MQLLPTLCSSDDVSKIAQTTFEGLSFLHIIMMLCCSTQLVCLPDEVVCGANIAVSKNIHSGPEIRQTFENLFLKKNN